ncbi:uncharacterized protein BDW43DRAFT_274807 [Aspergillus alliaceus]|uniref:uncharacterized protein n=1 Tax=Petromyces alliaceus TaxID=209559 RepID=UPI0012A3F09C|nr:uncharacterized protein BDW43DRAFT_274807 [Aspergillus alliaceus]KAB8234009.1 hypothetical protein BDW43DRAFT_274807 [Aspergillus alliaceus]
MYEAISPKSISKSVTGGHYMPVELADFILHLLATGRNLRLKACGALGSPCLQ